MRSLLSLPGMLQESSNTSRFVSHLGAGCPSGVSSALGMQPWAVQKCLMYDGSEDNIWVDAN